MLNVIILTELDKRGLNEKLQGKHGDTVLTSPVTITVPLNSDVTLSATMSDLKDAELSELTVNRDVSGKTDVTSNGRDSIQVKVYTNISEILTYTFVARLCSTTSDQFDVTLQVLGMSLQKCICDNS